MKAHKKILYGYFLSQIFFVTGHRLTKFDPISFLNPYRFTIMAKYIFAKDLLLAIDSPWGLELYRRHLEVWNNFIEQGDPTMPPEKEGFEEFVNSFKQTIASIKSDGFNQALSSTEIPYTLLSTPSNSLFKLINAGQHRIAICLLLEEQVYAYQIEEEDRNYNVTFLQSRGLEEKYIDAMAIEYAQLKKNCYMVFLFPTAHQHIDQIRVLLNTFGMVVYEKTLHLNLNGAHNLIKELYHDEPWIGSWDNNFKGAKYKMNACFPYKTEDNLLVCLWECDDLKEVKSCKEKIRSLCAVHNDSVHMNDTHDETVRLAHIVFNNNSIHNLNKKKLKYLQRFESFKKSYKKFLRDNNFNQEYFCIDGSAVLAAYGLRDCNDLDFLHFGYDQLSQLSGSIASHNDEIIYHATNKDNIIFNPENFFYDDGLKFCSLDIIKKMKQKRNEVKDRNDIKLMDHII